MTQLGTMMLRAGLLSEQQLTTVQVLSGDRDIPFVDALLELGLSSEDAVCAFFHSKLLIPRVDPRLLDHLDPAPLERLPAQVARRHCVLPVSVDDVGNVTLAMADPTDVRAVEAATEHTGAYLVRAVAPVGPLRRAVDRYYGADPGATQPGLPIASVVEGAARRLDDLGMAEAHAGGLDGGPPATAPAAEHPYAELDQEPLPREDGLPGAASPIELTEARPPEAADVASGAPAPEEPELPRPEDSFPGAPAPIELTEIRQPEARELAGDAAASEEPELPRPEDSFPDAPSPAMHGVPPEGDDAGVPAPIELTEIREQPSEPERFGGAPSPEDAGLQGAEDSFPGAPSPEEAVPPRAEDSFPDAPSPEEAVPPRAEDSFPGAPSPIELTEISEPPPLPADATRATSPAPRRSTGASRRAWTPPLLGIDSEPTPLSSEAFGRLLPRLVAARDRDEVTRALLDFLAAGFRRVILFVHLHEELSGRDARGGDLMVEAVRQVRIPSEGESIFSRVIRQRLPYFGPMPRQTDIDRAFSDALGGVVGNVLVLPVHLGEKVPLLVYASGTSYPVDPRSLRALTEAASHALSRLIVAKRSRKT